MQSLPPLQIDSAQTGAIPAAAEWLQNLVLGQVGTAIAVLAMAGVGFAMLHGRLDWRKGFRVVIGCFILFSAPSIARALADLANSNSSTPPQIVVPPPPVFNLPPPVPQNPDPYAGAAVPM